MPTRTRQSVVAIADPFSEEAELYELAFGAAGFALHPLPTDNPPEAVQEVVRAGAHLVVSRILPGRFGIDLVRAIRAHPATSRLPVVMLTSYTDRTLHADARAAGATEVVLLPVLPDDLIACARRLLA